MIDNYIECCYDTCQSSNEEQNVALVKIQSFCRNWYCIVIDILITIFFLEATFIKIKRWLSKAIRSTVNLRYTEESTLKDRRKRENRKNLTKLYGRDATFT